MKIIKLSAIESTNSFLRDLVNRSDCDHFTVVITDHQTHGRGQRNSKWVSEANKNLTFSVLIKNINVLSSNHKYLNFAVSLAVYQALKEQDIPLLKIKWPNDIMSASSKICGILIENQLKGSQIHSSIVGIGLNVNQVDFPSELTKVSSLKKIMKRDFNIDALLEVILSKLKTMFEILTKKDFSYLEKEYLNLLYKKDVPNMFEDQMQQKFLGIIRNISIDGGLVVELEGGNKKEFGLKEVKFL